MHQVGIDWADEQHEVCVLAPDGRILSEFGITHDWRGFQKLQATLEPLAPLKSTLSVRMVYWSIGW